MSRTGSSFRLARLALVITVMGGLSLTAPACKGSVEDLPDNPPIDDDWIDQIDEEEKAGAPGEVAVAAVPEEPGTELPGEPSVAADAEAQGDTEGAVEGGAGEGGAVEGEAATVAAVDPGTGQAAKVMAAPPSGSGGSGSGGAAAPTEIAPSPEDAPAEAAPIETAPAPEVAPGPAPAPEKPAPPPPITMADYSGTYNFTGGSSQRQDLADAIEDAAMQVSALIRNIARKRLTKTQILETPITITVSGDNVRFDLGTTGGNWSAQIDGPTTTMKYNGDKYKVKVRSKDGKMITVFMAPDATKTIVYVLSSDRKRLTVHHRLVADQLDTPVSFKFSYARK